MNVAATLSRLRLACSASSMLSTHHFLYFMIHDSQTSCQQGLGSGVGSDSGIDAGTSQTTSNNFGLADFPYRCRCIPGLFD